MFKLKQAEKSHTHKTENLRNQIFDRCERYERSEIRSLKDLRDKINLISEVIGVLLSVRLPDKWR